MPLRRIFKSLRGNRLPRQGSHLGMVARRGVGIQVPTRDPRVLQCVRLVAGGIEASARQLREMYAIVVGSQVMCKKTVHIDLRLHQARGLFAIVVAS